MSFFDIVAQLSDSMLRSTWIFLLTLVFSMPLGLLICVARMYAWKPVQWLMKFYISVVRGTPLMLQLLVIYFGKYFLFGLPLTTNYRFWAVIIAFSLNYAAYFAEIFRSGIQSIPVGQHEAAKILGYSRMQKFLRIITPQMIKEISGMMQLIWACRICRYAVIIFRQRGITVSIMEFPGRGQAVNISRWVWPETGKREKSIILKLNIPAPGK